MVAREFKEEPRISDLWATRGNVKALGICVFLAMLLQLSGIDVLLFYMEELLGKVGTNITASDGTIIMGVVQVFLSFISIQRYLINYLINYLIVAFLNYFYPILKGVQFQESKG